MDETQNTQTTDHASEISNLEAKINDLKTKAETTEGDLKQKYQDDLAKVTAEKESLMSKYDEAKKFATEAGNIEQKAKDMLGGLHL